MKTIKIITLVLFTLIGVVSFSQLSQRVIIEDKEFKLNGNPWFPLGVNYSVNIMRDGSGALYPVPNQDSFGTLGYGSPSAANMNRSRARTHMVNQFIQLKQLGFNSVRIIGLGFGYRGKDRSPWNASASWRKGIGIKTIDKVGYNAMNEAYQPNFSRALNVIEQVLSAANAVPGGIKVQILTGDDLVHYKKYQKQYGHFLEALSLHFSSNSALFAVDFCNEPAYHHLKDEAGSDLSTPEIYSLVDNWNNRIHKNSNILTTIGLIPPAEVYNWNPGILNIDFESYHSYGSLDKPFAEALQIFKNDIRWISEVSTKPWIIGETGFTAHHSDPPYGIAGTMGTLTEQLEFATETLATVRDCGGKGYTWWLWHDNFYNDGIGSANYGRFDSFGVPLGQRFGLIGPDGILKPAASAFSPANFDPFTFGNACTKNSTYYFTDRSIDHYDPINLVFSGKVYHAGEPAKYVWGVRVRQAINSLPMENAVVKAYNPSGKSYTTYTFSDGSYYIFAKYPEYYDRIIVSAYNRVKQDKATNTFLGSRTSGWIQYDPNFHLNLLAPGGSRSRTSNNNNSGGEDTLMKPTFRVSDQLLDDNVNIYPNPTTLSYLNIHFKGMVLDKPIKIIIFNTEGKEIFTVWSYSNFYKVNINNFETGTYIIKFIYGESTVTKKFIRQ